jgi:hypothetical protein
VKDQSGQQEEKMADDAAQMRRWKDMVYDNNPLEHIAGIVVVPNSKE